MNNNVKKIIHEKLEILHRDQIDIQLQINRLENILAIEPLISVSKNHLVIRCPEKKTIDGVVVRCSRIDGTHENHEFCYNGKRYPDEKKPVCDIQT